MKGSSRYMSIVLNSRGCIQNTLKSSYLCIWNYMIYHIQLGIVCILNSIYANRCTKCGIRLFTLCFSYG